MISFQTYLAIRAELREKIAGWMARAPWIHGVGFGLKQVAGRPIDQDALVFLVDTKVSEELLEREALVPKWIEFTSRGATFSLPSDVREERRPWFLSAPVCSITRPVHGGDCIAPLAAPFSGSIGVTVVRKSDRQPFILSASHTMKGIGGFLPPGQIICHPGGSFPPLATLSASTAWSTSSPMEGDAALAQVITSTDAASGINGIAGALGRGSSTAGDTIRFSGMHGVKTGTIGVALATVTVGAYKFENTLIVDPTDNTQLGELGDSGAVLVNSAGKITGIVFAGNGFKTYCTDLNGVASTLELENYDF